MRHRGRPNSPHGVRAPTRVGPTVPFRPMTTMRHSDFRFAAIALALAAPFAGAQTSFTDVTSAAGLAHFSETYGASWGELNGDGFPDLFVSNHRTMKSLYRSNGNG